MALSTEEKDALIELKNKGYSFSEAMGFIGSSRLGNTSKVERDYSQTTEPETPQDTSASADLKAGFQGAKDTLQAGMDRELTIESQGRSKPSELFGKFASGVRTAGGAIGSIATGAIRALPGGTTALNKIEDVTGKGIEKVATSELSQNIASTYRSLPQGVKNIAGDVGNIAMGGAELAGVLTVPGATRALTTGLKEFSQAGIKEVGTAGIETSIKTGLSPDDLMQRVARISKGKQSAFEERAGESIGSYLVNRGIFGDPEAITDQLYQRMQASKSRVDTGLAKVGGTYKDGTVKDALKQLADREARVSSENTPSPDQARVNALLSKHEREGLSLTEVNEVKRLYERNVKLDYLRDNVADGVAKANIIDNKLREFVIAKADQGGFKDVKALNRETFLAKQLLDDLGAEYAGQGGNNFMSLSDAIFLAEAASNPTALAAFGLKKTLGSKKIMSGVAKILANKRAKQGLPEGEVTGALALPPGQPGAGSTIFGGDTIELPANGAKLKGVVETGQENVRQPQSSEIVESPIKKIQDVETDALEEIRASMLDIADTGTATTKDGGYIRTTSFPSWIPQDSGLRSKELFSKVLEHIDNGTVPKETAGRQLELYALVKSQIEQRKFAKYAEAEKWTKADGSLMTLEDIPFSVLLATGAAGATYYVYGDEELVPMIGMVGMMTMTPGNKLKLINRQIDRLAKAEETLLRDGAKRSDSTVKSILEARTKLEKERASLPE